MAARLTILYRVLRIAGPAAPCLLVLALVLAGIAGPVPAGAAEPDPAAPGHVGSAVCASCHQAEAGAWTGSHHDLAWTEPTPETVLGDFGDVTFEHGGASARFFREGEGYFVETEGADGVRRPFEVVGVAGIAPLQQYLLAAEPGRTQAFDIAWDALGRRWYPLYPGQVAPPGDGFHWTGPYKSWEARCAECHATGYSRNYDPSTRRYSPAVAEIGVGCEACHGPGSTHVAQAEAGRWTPVPGLTEAGLTVDLGLSAQAEVQQCAGCHSRREANVDGNPVPGTDYHDAYSISLLRQGLYHPDGSILDEVYVTGSFLQSRMYAEGVRCTDCHDPHTARLKAEGNAVCTACHSPAGNAAFPTLRAAAYDDPAHHFHEPGTPGASCRSCHMIERTYMGIDGRRDHSFRVPRPDLASTGSPDACTDCHGERDPAWAAAEIARRFPQSAHRGPHFASVFAAARSDPRNEVEALFAVAEGDGAGIVRATALSLLAPLADPAVADRAARLLADPDPLVRAAAAGAMRGMPGEARLERLMPALTDDRRTVRIAAARSLLDAAPARGTAEAQLLASAMREWQGSMATRLDFPETHLQLGGVALSMRNWSMAGSAFREAAELDPQLVDAWVMAVRIAATTGDAAEAAALVEAGLAANPGDERLEAMAEELRALRQP